MDRRALIKQGGLAVVGLSLGACAPKAPPQTRPQTTPTAPKRPPLALPLVNASWDRIIRTTIGHRPHRPGGFMLRADKLDAKTVIHNYGHGGAGWSLSWGTASMAVDLAMAHETRRAAVLGAGIVGVTSARELQRRGFDVTIYAAALSPDTTSNKALAGFTPTSGLSQADARTPAWTAQFQQAVDIAYRRHQLMIGPKYGVTWIMNYAPTDNEQAGRGTNILLPASVQGSSEILGPGEHPFPAQYCIARPEMRFEPSIYLDALLQDFVLFGGKVVVRRFETARDIIALNESVVINCTGLGAKALFDDKDMVPLKGQLTVLVPQPEITYGTSGGNRVQTAEPGLGIHMMPRSDGIVLGGTSERDVWTTDVNESERKRIVDGHIELFDWMRMHPMKTADRAAAGPDMTRVICAVLALVAMLGVIAEGQFRQRGGGRGGRGGGMSFQIEPPGPTTNDGRFQFCRAMFRQNRYGDGGGWAVDFPAADVNLSIRLSELTKTPVSFDAQKEPNHYVVRLTDPGLFQCPFVMLTEVGAAYFDEDEAAALRAYMEKGGFVWADDFWGENAWEAWEEQLRKALPKAEFPIIELPKDHPIFRAQFVMTKTPPQIASLNYWYGTGSTSERGADSAVPHARAVVDKQGRIMILMTFNTDVGDSWEREGDDPTYFYNFSVDGYALGINVMLYTMTH